MYPGIPGVQPTPKRRHTARIVLLVITATVFAFIVMAVVGAALGSSSKPPASTSPISPAAPATPAAAPAPSPPPAGPVTIHFYVTGTGQPSITYGSDADNITPPGSLGDLGDGVALPFAGSLPFNGSAMYYDIDAQLEGSGTITCTIVATAPGYKPLTVSTGSASGGYNICSAQASPTDQSGLNWQAEG